MKLDENNVVGNVVTTAVYPITVGALAEVMAYADNEMQYQLLMLMCDCVTASGYNWSAQCLFIDRSLNEEDRGRLVKVLCTMLEVIDPSVFQRGL